MKKRYGLLTLFITAVLSFSAFSQTQTTMKTPEQTNAKMASPMQSQGSTMKAKHTLVDINQATLKELQALPGIGKSRAEAILSYRQKHGAFNDTHQLLKIRGVGKHTYARIEHLVTVQ